MNRKAVGFVLFAVLLYTDIQKYFDRNGEYT